jgi:hypothetical protein
MLTIPPPMAHQEAKIIINGVALTEGQSATVRVAVTSFLSSLTPQELKELGEIGPLYKARATEVIKLLLGI